MNQYSKKQKRAPKVFKDEFLKNGKTIKITNKNGIFEVPTAEYVEHLESTVNQMIAANNTLTDRINRLEQRLSSVARANIRNGR